MTLGKYPKYKDSGIEWIGEIPGEWSAKSISKEYDVQLGKMLQPNESTGSELKPYLRTANVLWNLFDLTDVKEMYILPSEKDMYSISKGDLLVCEGGDIGRAAIWTGMLEECYIQNSLHRIRPKSKASNKYLFYCLEAANALGEVERVCNKATIAHYTLVKVRRTKMPLPPQTVQEKAADFLDIETSKIQQLIDFKQHQIELLQEHEKSLIHRAVTKGLDPNAKMKDSGVEWIGKMPEGWTIKRIKDVMDINLGQSPEGELNIDEDGYPFYQGKTDFGEKYPTPSTWCTTSKKWAEKDDLLICVRAPVGDMNICREKSAIGRGIAALSSNYFEYYYYVLLSANKELNKYATGSTFEAIGYRELSGVKIPVPSEKERIAVASYLNSETAKIHQAFNNIEKSIAQLEEYRKALIYEVVTGKVKVS